MELTIANYWPSILTFITLQIIGLMSPGPDFAITMRNSLIYSRTIGIYTAIGIACGIMVHVSYTLLGVGLIITRTPWLFKIFQYAGAAYLFYIGFKGLQSKKHNLSTYNPAHQKQISNFAGFYSGFFTNALNPKAMLFFLSLFTAFLSPKTPGLIMFIYAFIVFMTTLTWFVVVALCFSHQKIRLMFSSVSHWIERLTGVVLILLAVKLLCM